MQAIVSQHDIEAAITLNATHTEKMHVLIIHTHHVMNTDSLLWMQEVCMKRWFVAEHSLTEIKVRVHFQIRVEAKET